MKRNYFKFYIPIILGSAFCAISSCDKLVDAVPVGRATTDIAYSDSTSAESNINGMYYSLQQNGNIYNGSFYAIFPLLSDEASIGSTSVPFYLELANNRIPTSNVVVSGLWTNNYKTIYQANSVLENIENVPMNAATMNQYKGEAHFIRAYCYFILSQYFNEVPLVTSTDFKVNASLSRSDTATVNAFILNELKQAETLLPSGFSAYGNRRIRACKESAQALLARVCLYSKDWRNAEHWATQVITSNPTINLAPTYEEVLKPNSTESLWEIWASSSSFAFRNNAASLLVPTNPTITTKPSVVPSDRLINSFEDGDKRISAYLGYSDASQTFYVNKYSDLQGGTDQGKIIRMSEVYLIRAEARAMLDNITGSNSAAEDLNKIRHRAGVGDIQASTKSEMVEAIWHERFVELLFENHRWFDLKRTGRIKEVMAEAKPTTWTPKTPIFLPVPATEIGTNPALLPQNEGY